MPGLECYIDFGVDDLWRGQVAHEDSPQILYEVSDVSFAFVCQAVGKFLIEYGSTI